LPIVPALGILFSLSSVAAGGAAGNGPVDRPREAVTVRLAGDRSLHGQIDPRTDRFTLWLRNGLESGFILRPIDWGRVAGVELDGERFSGEEFREAVAAAITMMPPDRGVAWGESGAPPPAEIVLGPSQRPSPPPAVLPVPRPVEVRSLAIDARLGNWDGDVEPDGLILDVLPLDAGGEVVPVHGTLDVHLLAEQVGIVQRPNPFERLGRWSRPVRPSDFAAGGASYRLPFQSADPERDLRWATHGAVHARLSVPASGVFAGTASMVRIRPYSAVRDRLEQTTGRRYFEVERTGLGNR